MPRGRPRKNAEPATPTERQYDLDLRQIVMRLIEVVNVQGNALAALEHEVEKLKNPAPAPKIVH
jgi:hypothetical protein